MIRFRCLHCGKTLKVLEGKAGVTVVCPRCKERCVAHGGAFAIALAGLTDSAEEPPSRGVAPHEDQAPGLWSGMSQRLRCAVALVGAVGALSLLAAVVAPLVPALAPMAETATHGAITLVPATAVILLVILYGHGAGCPACGKWWARTKGPTEFVRREVFDKGGVPFARATYQTIYECNFCRHRWSVSSTDEYKDFIRERPQKRLG